MSSELKKEGDSICPTGQMSFGDAVRYLQGGFDEPVQRAIQGHVRYCNACREELGRIRALRSVGGDVLKGPLLNRDGKRVHEMDSADAHIDAGTLAGYVDGGLEPSEDRTVTRHLAGCHECYVKFSELEQELSSVGARFATPVGVSEALKVAEPATRRSLSQVMSETLERAGESVNQLLQLKWPAPAMAFAVGVLVMLMVYPTTKTVIPLPGIGPVEDTSGRIRSGLDDGLDPTETITEVPILDRTDVLFTWPVPRGLNIASYRVDLLSATGERLATVENLKDNEWSLDPGDLDPSGTYTLTITASVKAGGVIPVTTLVFQLRP